VVNRTAVDTDPLSATHGQAVGDAFLQNPVPGADNIEALVAVNCTDEQWEMTGNDDLWARCIKKME
jgi:hypothetical protein